jgi:hypothetical protein
LKIIFVGSLFVLPLWILFLLETTSAILFLFDSAKSADPELRRWDYLSIGSMFLALGGLISLPAALIRVWTSERQVQTAEGGLVTDRISKAVQQLGADKTVNSIVTGADGAKVYKENGAPEAIERTQPNIEVRIGGLYALEQIATEEITKKRSKMFISVLETVCAYVRSNSQDAEVSENPYGEWENLSSPSTLEERREFAEELGWNIRAIGDDATPTRFMLCKTWVGEQPESRADVAVALEIALRLWKRRKEVQGGEGFPRLDLRQSRLQRIDVRGKDLDSAMLAGARLEGAMLAGASLVGARLDRARLAWQTSRRRTCQRPIWLALV